MQHLAIIADGNRRWAEKNNFPKMLGHAQGLIAIEKCCMWAIENDINTLTVYVFSTDNWNRPEDQVNFIMDLARQYFKEKTQWYINNNICVHFAGRRDRLAPDLVYDMYQLEHLTQDRKKLQLYICADYSGQDSIVRAIESGAKTQEEINAFITEEVPVPDVILRTGGHQRLSGFLLWQSAYSELIFTQTLFPDITDEELCTVLQSFDNTQRNFGV